MREWFQAFQKALFMFLVTWSEERPRRLPTVRIRGKRYFIDDRLRELRNIENPHDRFVLVDE
jgi:hypothetical protein